MKEVNLIIPAWMKLLATLEGEKPLHIATRLEITPSHVYNLVGTFKNRGWITASKVGRSTYIHYTKEGKELQQYIIPILKIIDPTILQEKKKDD